MEELTCRCGCGQMKMSPTMMPKLVAVRRETGIVMPVTSGYRCPRHNAEVSLTGHNGPHTTGHAVDIKVHWMEAYYVLRSAIAHGFTGIGVSQKGDERFLHLDDLTPEMGEPKRPWIWSY